MLCGFGLTGVVTSQAIFEILARTDVAAPGSLASQNVEGEHSAGSWTGRGDRIRTCDLLVPNQALYQAKLHPVIRDAYTRRLNLHAQFPACERFSRSQRRSVAAVTPLPS